MRLSEVFLYYAYYKSKNHRNSQKRYNLFSLIEINDFYCIIFVVHGRRIS